MTYSTAYTDANTGEVVIREWTPEEIQEREKRLASIRVIPPITPRQVRLLLLSQGLLSDVRAMIEQQDEATQIAWEYASEFRRDDPLLKALAKNLNLSDEQVDEFFIAASHL